MDPYINALLSTNETEPFNENFDSIGYGSMFFANNLGTLNLAFFFYLGLVAVL